MLSSTNPKIAGSEKLSVGAGLAVASGVAVGVGALVGVGADVGGAVGAAVAVGVGAAPVGGLDASGVWVGSSVGSGVGSGVVIGRVALVEGSGDPLPSGAMLTQAEKINAADASAATLRTPIFTVYPSTSFAAGRVRGPARAEHTPIL